MPVTVIRAGRRQIFDMDPAAGSAAPADEQKRSLSRFLWLEGRLPPRPLCGGIGHCGRCRVRYLSDPPPPTPAERRILSPKDLADGVRLSCRHPAEDGIIIATDEAEEESRAPATGRPRIGEAPPFLFSPRRSARDDFSHGPRLAVDLGTTSVAWRAEDENGDLLASGQALNPQMCAGSDVMSRLAVASRPEGARRMRDLAVEFLRNVTDSLEAEGKKAAVVGLAANPAMTALTLGLNIAGLSAAPYLLPPDLEPGKEGTWRSAFLPPLWIPPQIGPFVGGDISAGLATLLDAPRPFLLADMGTNGEFVLVPAGGPPLLAASVPLGPALEGVGLRCGGLAGPGGVTAFHPGPDGLRAVTPDGSPPRHVCGTGYLSLLYCLQSMRLIDQEGRFAVTPPAVPGPLEFLRRRLAASLGTDPDTGEAVLPLPGNLFLSAGDVESLLEVKAAFSLAVERLLTEAGMGTETPVRIFLAGALGLHAPLDALDGLGFLPAGSAGRTTAVGNASLDGVALLLRRPELRDRLNRLLTSCRVLHLAADPAFLRDFVRHMRFGNMESR